MTDSERFQRLKDAGIVVVLPDDTVIVKLTISADVRAQGWLKADGEIGSDVFKRDAAPCPFCGRSGV